MYETSRSRLTEFVRRVDIIEAYSYLENAEDIVGATFNKSEDGWKIDFYQPDNEKRDALLMNLRLFVQNKDEISIGRMAELCADPGISDEWKTEFEAIRSSLNEKLDRVAAEGNKGRITHHDVKDMFLFGAIGHYDTRDPSRKLFENWVTDETEFEILHNTFHVVIVWILTAIMNIFRASKEELERTVDAQEKGSK